MVYRPKNREKDTFTSEGRLRLGHEAHPEAPDLQNLREEVYNGVKDILHQNTIDDRMASCHDTAVELGGWDEET